MLSSKSAQYTTDRDTYVEPSTRRIEDDVDAGYDLTVRKGRDLVWVPCGLTWQMLPSYGGVARHFTATHAKDGLNFSPNKTTDPHFHESV